MYQKYIKHSYLSKNIAMESWRVEDESWRVDWMRTVENEFKKIVHSYLNFLSRITYEYSISNNTSDIDVNKRKFEEVRKSLFEFVKLHNGLFAIKHFRFIVNTTVVSEFDFPFVDSAKNKPNFCNCSFTLNGLLNLH